MRNFPEGRALRTRRIPVLPEPSKILPSEEKIREPPEEIKVLGLDTVTSMWMCLVLEKLLERHSSFPGMDLIPALFVSAEPGNPVLFIGTHQEILLLEFPSG